MEWYVDKKYTIWERTYYEGTEGQFNKFVEDIKADDTLEPSGDTFYESEFLHDTMDPVPVEQNNGDATVEVFVMDSDSPFGVTHVHDNSIKKDE